MAENQSFLPEDYLEKRAQTRTTIICVSLFLIVLTGVVAAWVVSWQQYHDVVRHQRQVRAQFEEAAKRLEQFEKLQAQREQMIHKAQVTGTLIERVPRSVLLAELINSMPPNLSLLDMKVDTKVISRPQPPVTAMARARNQKQVAAAPVKPQPPETQVTIVLTGVAPTDVQVAQFMSSLGGNVMFANQHLGFSEESKIKDQSMRKFRVDIELAPGIDVQRHEPRMVKRELLNNPMSSKMQIVPDGAFQNTSESQQRSDAMPALQD
jgi:hypothetical protein